MTTALDLHDATVLRLRTLDTVHVHDGEVDEPVAADHLGRAFPYAVVWPSAGFRPGEQPLDNEHRDGLTWPVRVTVAAGDAGWTMQAAGMVRNLLDGWRPTPLAVLTEEVLTWDVQRDTSTDPVRWYVPLLFRTTI